MSEPCEHLASLTVANFPARPTTPECADCLREGTTWVALRQCRDCGNVGCCDSSPGRHATAHHVATQHPVMRSVMGDDTWSWCYVDEVTGSVAG